MTTQLTSLLCVLGLLLSASAVAAQKCALDTNGDGRTTVNELVFAVNEALTGCGQVCALDRNGDNQTTVNELVFAVNEALVGCGGAPATPTRTPTPTPTVMGCSLDFNDNNLEATFCSYNGPAESSCYGAADWWMGWQSDGSHFVSAVLRDPSTDSSLGVAASRTSATSARVSGLAFGPDFDRFFTATGSLSLPNRTQFIGNVNTTTSCTGISFSGTFYGMLGGPEGVQAESESLMSAMKRRLERDDRPPTPPPNDIDTLLRRFRERAVIEGLGDPR